MLKKKAFNRIFLTTIVFFLVFSLYTLKDVNYTLNLIIVLIINILT